MNADGAPSRTLKFATDLRAMIITGRYADRYRRSLFGRRESDEAVTQIEVSGITLRWPARRWTRGAGSFEDV